MNLFKIIFSNLRKRKGASITFLIMVIMSALMLSISLSLMIGGADFYDKKVDELNAPHFSNFISAQKYKEEFRDYAENYDGVTEVSVLNTLCAIGSWKIPSGSDTGTAFFYNIAEVNENAFWNLKIIDEQTVKPSNMILLPLSFKTKGIKAGRTINFEMGSKNYDFMVGGFFEDTVTGSSTMGSYFCYISSDEFDLLKTDDNYSKFISIMLRFEKHEMHRTFVTDFRKITKLNNNEEFIATFDGSKTGAMTFIDMISMILIVFAIIVLLIAFIVMNFSIGNSISEDIIIIGALKSIGYKNKILKVIQLIQYLLIAFIGSAIGSVIALFTFGFIGNIIASTSGLLWLNSANFIPVLITIALICILTLFITYFAVRKYKKITPINALRQGESDHSFKRNAMPLERFQLPLNLHLGIKRFFKSIKNNITLCIIVALLVFISVVVNSVNYNLNEDRTAMVNMVGLEMADVWIMANPGTDIYTINEELKEDIEVKNTNLSGSKTCFINEFETTAEAKEDYSKLVTNTLIKGKYPALKNEINLSAVVATTINKGVGDTVTIEIDDAKHSYIVVGITQSIGGDAGCNMIYEAILDHNSEFIMDTIYVYLKNGTDAKLYNDYLINKYGNKVLTVVTNEQMDMILSSMGDPFAIITIIMIIITLLIIAVVLYLIMSTLIRKQKKELGIMKAIGYKNKQLIKQMLISFFPSLALGSIIGVVLGFIVTNPLLSVFFSSAGLLKTYFIIPILATNFIGLGIFIASIIITYFISLRLRKISPQKLIVEQ